MGMMAMMPMSPMIGSIECSTHHSVMVSTQTNETQYCFNVKASRIGRMDLIWMSPSPVGDRAGR